MTDTVQSQGLFHETLKMNRNKNELQNIDRISTYKKEITIPSWPAALRVLPRFLTGLVGAHARPARCCPYKG